MGTNGASLAFRISLDPWSSSYEERETSVSLDTVIEESSDNYKMFQVPTSFWPHSRIRPPRIFFLINYFNWRLITLKYCGCFCHTLTWISHGCTCVPESQSPLPPPSLSYPSGLSQCTGSECPVSCIELGLVIYFTHGSIHVQCYSLKSSHHHLPPQSSKDCSIHLFLFCCLTFRVIISIFLNSIYMH